MNSECQLLRSKFDVLHTDMESAAADTAKLANQLYSRNVVGRGVRSAVDDAATPGKAASKLLGAVENRIESHPRDLHVFVECLAKFATWEHHAEDMAMRMKEIEAQMVQPLPVSEPSTCSPASVGGGGHPVDIRLVIFPNGGARGDLQPGSFVLRSAPVHRKHPPQPTTPQSTTRPFNQTSSPSTTSLSSLVTSEHSTPTSTASLPIITEETTDDLTPPTDGIPLRTPSLGSQTSTSSTYEEDVILIKGSLDELMAKHCSLRRKLCSREKHLQGELTKSKEAFATALETANQETNDLKKQVDSLTHENQGQREDLDRARESVLASNQQKQTLLQRNQMLYDKLKQSEELCLRLKEQVKAATQDGGSDLLEKYQRSRDRERELEEQLEACRNTVTEYGDKIELLEVEVNILVGPGSLSLSSSFSDTDMLAWAMNPEQEDSGGLGSSSSLGSI